MANSDKGNMFQPASEEAFTPPEISRVGVRMPPFWPEEPGVWFAQLECNFTLSRITDDATKFNYVISQLEQRYATDVKDIILNPPVKDKYEKLKQELIKRLSASREKEIKQLLMHEELGDRRPSQFLRHLKNLAGPSIPDDFIRTIWSSRLPRNLQTVIASQPTSALESLTELADKVFELVPPSPHVASTEAVPGSLLDKMSQQIADLTRQVQALTASNAGRNRHSRSRSRNQDRSRTRSQSNYKRFPVCFYHHKYGDNARSCMKPCDYKAGNAQSGR